MSAPRLRRALERWAFTAYRASAHELAALRMLIAAYLIVRSFPLGLGVSRLPAAFFDPPLGLPALFTGFVGEGTLLVVHAATAASLIALLLGARTALASYASTACLVLLQALVAAAGKVDHTILVVLCPAMMARSGWGAVWSRDALRLGSPLRHAARRRGRWQLAWLALATTLAMASAGLAKLYTGWLDPGIAASYGHAVANSWLSDRHTLAGALLLRPALAPAWELLDWATVLFELLAPLAVVRPRWMRAWCVAACGFHLGVGLTMDIWFAANVVVYAAFLPWRRLLPPPSPSDPRRLGALGAAAIVVVVALTALGFRDESISAAVRESVGRAIVLSALPVVLCARVRGRRSATGAAAVRVA